MDEQIKRLKEYMDASNYTVAVTGAGISYMYGMRRFKQQVSRTDMTRKLAPKYVKAHPDEVYGLLKNSFFDVTFEKGPSPVHYQLAELEKKGLLQGIATQNLDCLHTLAGSTNVAEFMGSFADNVCLDCGATLTDVNVWNQGEMPRCPKCGGYMVPEFFSGFGRRLPIGGRGGSKDRMERAKDMITQADLVIVIGTTGFRSDEYMSKMRRSTKVVQINPGSTIFDQMADLNIRMDAETVFNQILAEE